MRVSYTFIIIFSALFCRICYFPKSWIHTTLRINNQVIEQQTLNNSACKFTLFELPATQLLMKTVEQEIPDNILGIAGFVHKEELRQFLPITSMACP